MDDIGCFLIYPVTLADVEALHAAVRAACAHVKLPVDRMRVAYGAHAHPRPTFGSPFVVVHLHVGTADDVVDPYLFTIETHGSDESCSLAAHVCAAFDLATSEDTDDALPGREVLGWTVAREARSNYHSVVSSSPDVDEGFDESESAEPLETLASELRLAKPALVDLLLDPVSPWTPLSADLDASVLAALRPLLPSSA